MNDDNTVTVRPVKTGRRRGRHDRGIDSGLKAGERVVTDGVDRIREGAKVDVIVPGAAAPKGGGDASKRDASDRKKTRGHDARAARRLRRNNAGSGEGNGSVNPSRIFILRPVATALLMVAILLAGIVAYRQLPLSALPRGGLPDDPGRHALSRARAPT